MEKNSFLSAIKKFWPVMLVLILVGFFGGFFATSYIVDNNFSYYTFNFTSPVSDKLIISDKYFDERVTKINEYNAYVKSYTGEDKLSTVYIYASTDYKDLADNALVKEVSPNVYQVRIQKRYFGDTFVTSSKTVSEGLTKCKRSITSILTAKLGTEAPSFDVTITTDFELTDYSNPYAYGGLCAFAMLLFSFCLVFVLSKAKNKDNMENIADNKNIFNSPFHKEYWKSSLKCFKDVKSLTVIAMLFAMMLVTKLFKLPSGFGALDISFGFLFFSMISMIYGPVAGLVIGIFSDTLGYFLFPTTGAYFPGYTLDAMLAGFTYGICFYKTKLTFGKCLYARIFVNLFVNVWCGSIWKGIISGFTEWSQFTTYMLIISLPKNLVYLFPQAILLFIVLRVMTRPFAAFGLIDSRIKEHVTLF